jgi:hypothetical protein
MFFLNLFYHEKHDRNAKVVSGHFQCRTIRTRYTIEHSGHTLNSSKVLKF